MAGAEQIRAFWDDDAATYDLAHQPRSAAVQAAWNAALARFLPPAPAHVLDAGAGTGFLSLAMARLGYHVTALDLSGQMLARLSQKAGAAGLRLDTVEADAADPPCVSFDAVVERHVIWTLPDPAAALNAWRQAAPTGRLVLFESLWGTAAGPAEQARARLRAIARKLRGTPPEHHGAYGDALKAQLPLSGGTPPEHLAGLVSRSDWGGAALHRLRDIEWATACSIPLPERMLGTAPRFAVTAGTAG